MGAVTAKGRADSGPRYRLVCAGVPGGLRAQAVCTVDLKSGSGARGSGCLSSPVSLCPAWPLRVGSRSRLSTSQRSQAACKARQQMHTCLPGSGSAR